MNLDLSRVQSYLEWMKKKLYLDQKARNASSPFIRFVKRGQVYECEFGVGVGSEQEKSFRPCVILQNYDGNRNSPNTIVAPISHTTSTLPIVVPLTPQMKPDGSILLDGSVLLGNIVTISKARLTDYVTELSSNEMSKIDIALAKSVDLYRHYNELAEKVLKKEEYISSLKEQRNKYEDDLKEIFELLGVSDLEEAKKKLKKL